MLLLSLFLSVTILGEIHCDIYRDGRGLNTEISGEEVGCQNGTALLEFGKSIDPNSEATLNVMGAIISANTNGIASNPVSKAYVKGATINANTNANNLVSTANVTGATISANTDVNDNTQHQTGTSNNQDVPSNPAGPPNVEGATANVKGKPLIGSNEGSVKETNTSSSWGFNAGIDAGLSLEAGMKDGPAVIGAKKHLGANIGGNKESSSKETIHPLFPTPPPNTFPGFGSPYYPGNGLPYYPNYQQFPSQFPPQAGQQYVPQPMQQYPQWSPFGPQPMQQYPQWSPFGPQYAQQPYVPQYG